MKKAFEFLLVLIIFYGVYSGFAQLAPMFFDAPNTFHIVAVSLVVAALLLVLYAAVISSKAKLDYKKIVSDLRIDIEKKELMLREKDEEIKRAQSFKEDLLMEAEKTIDTE